MRTAAVVILTCLGIGAGGAASGSFISWALISQGAPQWVGMIGSILTGFVLGIGIGGPALLFVLDATEDWRRS